MLSSKGSYVQPLPQREDFAHCEKESDLGRPLVDPVQTGQRDSSLRDVPQLASKAQLNEPVWVNLSRFSTVEVPFFFFGIDRKARRTWSVFKDQFSIVSEGS